jgi:hypothetical protein
MESFMKREKLLEPNLALGPEGSLLWLIEQIDVYKKLLLGYSLPPSEMCSNAEILQIQDGMNHQINLEEKYSRFNECLSDIRVINLNKLPAMTLGGLAILDAIAEYCEEYMLVIVDDGGLNIAEQREAKDKRAKIRKTERRTRQLSENPNDKCILGYGSLVETEFTNFPNLAVDVCNHHFLNWMLRISEDASCQLRIKKSLDYEKYQKVVIVTQLDDLDSISSAFNALSIIDMLSDNSKLIWEELLGYVGAMDKTAGSATNTDIPNTIMKWKVLYKMELPLKLLFAKFWT